MDVDEAREWVTGRVSLREAIIDSCIAAGALTRGEPLTPDMVVSIAVADHAMTHRASIIVVHHELDDSRECDRRECIRLRTAEASASGAVRDAQDERDAFKRELGDVLTACNQAESERDSVCAELAEVRRLVVRTMLERDGLQAQLETRWDGVERRGSA